MRCQNPFFPCKSKHPNDIAVIILYKGKQHPICKECWAKIANNNIEWGENFMEKRVKSSRLSKTKSPT